VGVIPSLTAYENIILGGVTQGIPYGQIKKMVPDILNFFDLAEFKNMPLKHFSSGMASKLKFAIAVKTSSEIMVMDEVFAVGDIKFGAKALEAAESAWLTNEQTVVMISHSLPRMQQYCDRVMYLKDGVIKAIGDPDLVCREYRRDVDPNFKEDKNLDALRDKLIAESEK
jgi:ABC-type polysaccharide/polyol phosphate transport system ATPase subunit